MGRVRSFVVIFLALAVLVTGSFFAANRPAPVRHDGLCYYVWEITILGFRRVLECGYGNGGGSW